MQTFTTYFRLTFQSGKVVLIKINILLFLTKDQKPFDDLSKQLLVMKGNISSSILKRKNYPGSQAEKS